MCKKSCGANHSVTRNQMVKKHYSLRVIIPLYVWKIIAFLSEKENSEADLQMLEGIRDRVRQ